MGAETLNKDILNGQSEKLLDWLKKGNRINCFSPSIRTLKIGYLNSRIADIRKMGIAVKSDWIRVINSDGKPVFVKNYYL